MKNHFWFDGIDWKKLEEKKLESPFRFKYNSNKYLECKKLQLSKIMIKRYRKISKTIIYKNLIKYFDYANISIID